MVIGRTRRPSNLGLKAGTYTDAGRACGNEAIKRRAQFALGALVATPLD